MAIRIRSAGKTDVGLKRDENQDNFIMLPDAGLYVLADGMGGHASGKLASTLAVTLITEFVCVRAKQPNFQWEYPPDESVSFHANVLANAIKFANERIFIEACKNPANEGMGTTVCAVLDAGDHLAVAHVGDSRVYRMRNGKLHLITADHSLRNHLISIGELTPENEHKFKNTNVIIRAVGLKDYVEVTAQTVDRVAGDLYMTCSDGLTDLVPDHVIEQVMRKAPDLPTASDTLIRLALQAGGKDNVTVVCLRLDEVDEPSDARRSPQAAHPQSGVSNAVAASPPPTPQKRLLHAVRHPSAWGVLPTSKPSFSAGPPSPGPSPSFGVGSQPQGLTAVQPPPTPEGGLNHLNGVGPGAPPPEPAWADNTDPELHQQDFSQDYGQDFGQDFQDDGEDYGATIQEMPAWTPDMAQQQFNEGGGQSGTATIGGDTPTDLPTFSPEHGSDTDTAPSIQVDPDLLNENGHSSSGPPEAAGGKVLIDPSLLQESSPPKPKGPPKPPQRPKYRARNNQGKPPLPPHLRNRNK